MAPLRTCERCFFFPSRFIRYSTSARGTLRRLYGHAKAAENGSRAGGEALIDARAHGPPAETDGWVAVGQMPFANPRHPGRLNGGQQLFYLRTLWPRSGRIWAAPLSLLAPGIFMGGCKRKSWGASVWRIFFMMKLLM